MDATRREVLKGMGAAIVLNAFSDTAEANRGRFRYFSSELSMRNLERQRNVAITSLADSIPLSAKANYLRAYIPYLQQESQMYIPEPHELHRVVQKSEGKIDELVDSLTVGSYGLFAFADSDAQGARTQRLYVIQRANEHTAKFLKAYRISMAENGFGNQLNSEQTPLGPHTIHSKTIGNFGEVVSHLKKYKNNPRLFTHIPHGGTDHWYVNSFGRENGNEVAEVVTDEYLLVGPDTNPSRAIRIHGTNRSGEIAANGKWISYLDGKVLSGACLRVSNVDIRDMGLAGYIGIGTQVMIHATSEAKARSNIAKKNEPVEWIPPSERAHNTKKIKKEPEEWIPSR